MLGFGSVEIQAVHLQPPHRPESKPRPGRGSKPKPGTPRIGTADRRSGSTSNTRHGTANFGSTPPLLFLTENQTNRSAVVYFLTLGSAAGSSASAALWSRDRKRPMTSLDSGKGRAHGRVSVPRSVRPPIERSTQASQPLDFFVTSRHYGTCTLVCISSDYAYGTFGSDRNLAGNH